MTYTVVWRPQAERKLAEIWLNSCNPNAISKAADTIDSLLRLAPASAGESRSGTVRLLYVPPLAVYYDVLHDDRLVAVWAVWQHPPESNGAG